ncbi:MAG: exonuclease domain-containing protein [Gammaproteobacteria bacterium]|nr:exonuclease domain-containing protein [Gammaproteobacteria bacterium]
MMLAKLFGKDYLRKRLLKKTKSSVMREYLSTPFPDNNDSLMNVEIVSLDFETTGLDIERDNVISIGFVDVINLGINLGTSTHHLIATNAKLPENSVVIHQITDNALVNGESIATVLPDLLKHLTGKVLLAHNAKVEVGFLNKMCQQFYGSDFLIPVIDTQYLAKRSFDRKNISYKSAELRMFNLRASLNMPAYKAHNALMDAIATAELFLALVSKISPKNNARLKDVLC